MRKTWKPQTIMITNGKPITYCAHNWLGFDEEVLQVVFLWFCGSSDQWKSTVQQRFYKEFERDFYMKIILIKVSTNLFSDSLLSFFVLS